MDVKHEKQDSISVVFGLLGLETAEERERLRLLADLGRIGEEPGACRYEPADTRNNTARHDDYAQLEPTS
jgi:hypothetical protein